MTLPELLAALEAATEDDHDLSRMVDGWLMTNDYEFWKKSKHIAWATSIDAALTLFRDGEAIMEALDAAHETISRSGYVIADTAALKWRIIQHLLIAALKARAQ